jgi:integrase
VAGIQKRTERSGVVRYVVRSRAPDGTDRSRSFHTRREAVAYRGEVERAQARGEWADPRGGAVTFGEVAEAWHAGRVGLADTSRARDRSYLDSLVLPRFGRAPLAAIAAGHVREWVADLEAAGKSPATIAKAAGVVRAVLRAAVADRLIAADPLAGGLELPRRRRRPPEVLTAAQVGALVDAAGPFYSAHVATLAGTGLRFGELAGLGVAEVDPLRGELTVRRQLVEIAGRLELADRLKTAHSHRVVTLPRYLAERIAEHLARWPNDAGLVFTTPTGAMLRRSNFARRVLRPAAVAAGLPTVTAHTLRHTHASLLLAAGEPITNVSRRLGHESPAVTLAVYSHVIPGDNRGAAERFGDLMAAALPTPPAEVLELEPTKRGRTAGEPELG